MAKKNNFFESPEKVTEWLCSTGYLFPSNEAELSRFDKLFSDVVVENSTVSIDRILNNNVRAFPESNAFKTESEQDVIDEFRMVARKGLEGLPDHVIKRMLDNQNNGDKGSSKEED